MGPRVVLLLVAILALLPQPASAQAQTGSLAVQLESLRTDTGGTLNAGRLMPGLDTFTIEARFRVEFPPMAYCATSEVRMYYEVRYPWVAQVELSPKTETRSAPGPVPAVLPGGPAMQGQAISFSTTVSVRLLESAPAFAALPIELVASATPLQSPFACSVGASYPLTVTTLVVPDYIPRLELVVPEDPWATGRVDGEEAQASDRVTFSAANLGNGDSRLWFEFESLGQGWITRSEVRTLESRAVSGEKALWRQDVVLSRIGEPEDWTGRIKVTMTAVQSGSDIRKDEQLIYLGPPPPWVPTATEDPARELSSEVESLPGWGGLASIAALGAAFLRRRA